MRGIDSKRISRSRCRTFNQTLNEKAGGNSLGLFLWQQTKPQYVKGTICSEIQLSLINVACCSGWRGVRYDNQGLQESKSFSRSGKIVLPPKGVADMLVCQWAIHINIELPRQQQFLLSVTFCYRLLSRGNSIG